MPPRRRRHLHAALAVALAVLVPLQAALACLAGIAGPRHVHDAAEARLWVLEDVRRAVLPRHDLERGVAGDAGRPAFSGHTHATAERHLHAPSQAIRLLPGEAPSGDDGLAGAGALPLAWLASDGGGLARVDARSVLVAGVGWPALTHDVEPLDRPPRRG